MSPNKPAAKNAFATRAEQIRAKLHNDNEAVNSIRHCILLTHQNRILLIQLPQSPDFHALHLFWLFHLFLVFLPRTGIRRRGRFNTQQQCSSISTAASTCPNLCTSPIICAVYYVESGTSYIILLLQYCCLLFCYCYYYNMKQLIKIALRIYVYTIYYY